MDIEPLVPTTHFDYEKCFIGSKARGTWGPWRRWAISTTQSRLPGHYAQARYGGRRHFHDAHHEHDHSADGITTALASVARWDLAPALVADLPAAVDPCLALAQAGVESAG